MGDFQNCPRSATDLNDLGAIPGNDIAIKPYREKLPFPEGTIIAWLAWSCIPNLRHRRRAAARRGLAKEGYHDCSTNLTLGELIRKKMANLTQEIRSNEPTNGASAARVDMKFEIVVIPVSDVDRAKEFYAKLGWRLDADFDNDKDFRVIQFTPPGSGCSIIFGKNVTAAAPGSAQGLYLIVSDIEAARKELLDRGIQISKVFHGASGVYAGRDEPYLFGRNRVSGPDEQHGSYRSFASFSDPDGNGWLFQEVTTRLPGRIDSTTTTFASTGDLASALRRAEAAHGQHEKRTGQRDANWPDWYAEYMVREQSGKELPQ
jgi:catechol 2,3-dioxygenase-like lactoylglutathione lyase family enzyme